MFLHFPSPRLFKKAHPAKNKHVFLSLSKFIVFGVLLQLISFSASAHQECIEIPISYYDQSGAYNAATGTYTTTAAHKQKYTTVCYQVPDTVEPTYGGGGAAGAIEEEEKAKTEAKKKEQQEKYCKSQPAEIELKKETCIADAIRITNIKANQCSNFSWGFSWYGGFNYNPSCRSDWAGVQAEQVQRCNVVAAEAVVALAKECP